MKTETKELLENAKYLYISFTDGTYKVETEKGFVIEDSSVSITLSTPLQKPIHRDIESYLLDDTTIASGVPVDIEDLKKSGRLSDDEIKKTSRALVIIAYHAIVEVVLNNTNKSELLVFPDFKLSTRLSCDVCKEETIVLTKTANTLYFNAACNSCIEKIKKHVTTAGFWKTKKNQ